MEIQQHGYASGCFTLLQGKGLQSLVLLHVFYLIQGEVSSNDFPARIIVSHPGTASLSVRTVSDVSTIATRNAILEDSVLLEVVQKLEVVSDSQLFLPFGTQSQIRTTRDGSSSLSFSVQIAYSARSEAQSELRVSSNGVITTGNTPLTATIFITDSYKGLNQTVAIFVEVAAVAHISVTPSHLLWPPNSENNAPYLLPVGLSASFIVRQHDASGRSFHACDHNTISVRQFIGRHFFI